MPRLHRNQESPSHHAGATTVVLTTSFPVDRDDPSGHFVATSARQLAESGERVHVVAAGHERAFVERRGAVVIHWQGLGKLFAWPGAQSRLRQRPRLAWSGAQLWWRVARTLRSLQPTRLVAHWMVPSVWPLATSHLASRVAGVPVTVQAHAHGADVRMLPAMPPPLRHHVARRIVACCNRITFASAQSLDALADSLETQRTPRSELLAETTPCMAERLRAISRVQAPPIDVAVAESRKQLRQRLCFDQPTAVAVGRLIPSKRFDLAVAAAERAGMQLVVVGDGPCATQLRSSATRARFVGALPRQQTLEYIAAADVLLHPSRHEAAPTVVREARQLGVLVLACAAGDVARWARDDPGISIVPPDPIAISRALQATMWQQAKER